MELGVLTNLYANRPLDDVLAQLSSMGVTMAEIGCGGFPGKAHCDPAVLLRDDKALAEFLETFKRHNMKISALSTHGNCVHPNKEIASAFEQDFRQTVLLAEKIGIDTVVTFSGCPGDHEGAKYPNWVTCPWPEDFLEILDYQWNEVLIPFWKDMTAYCCEHGIHRIAFEMHPGFCVYNPATLLKLRAAVGDEIGANVDPSHLIWQGMDPVAAIRELRGAIYHFHAKDTKINEYNTARNGVLDTKHYADEVNRSWIFRSVGYGMNEEKWREIMSELVLAGYDRSVSIEHEDSLMAPEEGLEKAIELLKRVLIRQGKPTDMWWA